MVHLQQCPANPLLLASTEMMKGNPWGGNRGLHTVPANSWPLHPLWVKLPRTKKDLALPVTAYVSFYILLRSFCQEHNPAQTVEVQQGGETLCVICLECVGDKLSYHTTVCPNCRQAWFHRGCIQVRGPSSAPEAWQVPDKGAALTLLVCSSSAAIGFPRWAALFPVPAV